MKEVIGKILEGLQKPTWTVDHSLAALRKEALERMDQVVKEYPLALEYEADARIVWPERWESLRDWLQGK